jgi:hypothetical protein
LRDYLKRLKNVYHLEIINSKNMITKKYFWRILIWVYFLMSRIKNRTTERLYKSKRRHNKEVYYFSTNFLENLSLVLRDLGE